MDDVLQESGNLCSYRVVSCVIVIYRLELKPWKCSVSTALISSQGVVVVSL
jgi:hypothetical protein